MPGSSEGANKAWVKMRSPQWKARKQERVSKDALREWCKANRWKVVFFEGESGAPRTGIVDALMVRIKPRESDSIEIKLVQLKSGSSGLTAKEIRRLKDAMEQVSKDWVLAAYDGEALHFLPNILSKKAANAAR